MNATDLAQLRENSGPERTERFLELAGDHLRRIERADWDVILGEWSGLGPLTVGEHSGVAIGEWHVHAWDMARSLGIDHRPTDDVIVAEGNPAVLVFPFEGDAWRGSPRRLRKGPWLDALTGWPLGPWGRYGWSG